MAIVEVLDLRKQYDPPKGVLAVDGVSFEIAEGEIFSLLGPNGAGKSTTISMLSCLLQPSGGDARVAGHSVVSDAQAVKEAIGVVPQDIALYPDMSARENLRSGARCTACAATSSPGASTRSSSSSRWSTARRTVWRSSAAA